MQYYFCVCIPWENTDITVYDTLEELRKEQEEHMKRYNDWYVIKGEEIKELINTKEKINCRGENN